MMTVNEVSRLTGVSIRTLHYYDQLGQLYAAGGAFTENINAAGGDGTAEFARKAIEIYCKDSQGVEGADHCE